MHITTVRPSEMMLDALMRCDLIAVSTREAAKLFTLPGGEPKIPEFGTGATTDAPSWKTRPPIGALSLNYRKSWRVK